MDTSTSHLKADIGRTVAMEFGRASLVVKIKINDVKSSFGMKRWLVGVDGQDSNLVWVNAPRKPRWTDK